MKAPNKSGPAPRLHLAFSDGRPKGKPIGADSNETANALCKLLYRAEAGELRGFAIALATESGEPELMVAGSLRWDTARGHWMACKLCDALLYPESES